MFPNEYLFSFKISFKGFQFSFIPNAARKNICNVFSDLHFWGQTTLSLPSASKALKCLHNMNSSPGFHLMKDTEKLS